MVFELSVLVVAIVASLAYAVTGMLKNLPKGEAIEPVKFGATMVLGVGVGVFLAFTGVPIDENNVLVAMATYAGFLVVIENGIKAVLRYLEVMK